MIQVPDAFRSHFVQFYSRFVAFFLAVVTTANFVLASAHTGTARGCSREGSIAPEPDVVSWDLQKVRTIAYAITID